MQPSASCYRCGGGGSSSSPLDDDKELDLAASRQSLPGIPMVVYALLFLAHHDSRVRGWSAFRIMVVRPRRWDRACKAGHQAGASIN